MKGSPPANSLWLRSLFSAPRRGALVGILIALSVLLSLWWRGGLWYQGRLITEQRARVADQLTPYENALTTAIHWRFALLQGLAAFVKGEPSEASLQSNFDAFVGGLYASANGIHNFAVAPGGVVRYVYPSAGNKDLIGYNHLRDGRSDVSVDVQRAIRSRSITLGKPRELWQAEGLVARLAIYKQDTLWGILSMVVDESPIMEESGLSSLSNRLNIALRDNEGHVFYGHPSAFENDPVISRIELPDGSWELAGTPPEGWITPIEGALLGYRITGLTIIGLLLSLVYLVINRHARLSLAVSQRTRQLSLINEQLSLVTDGVPILIAYIDAQKRLLFANRSYEECFGRSKEELIGMHIKDVLGEESYQGAVGHIESVLTGRHVSFENTIKDGAGQKHIMSVTLVPHSDATGMVNAYFSLSHDITERKQAEETLRLSEDKFSKAFRTSPDAININRLSDGTFVDINDGFTSLTGFTHSDVQAKSVLDIDLWVNPADRERLVRELQVHAEVKDRETEFRTKDGSVRVGLMSARTIEVNGEKCILSITRDITERRRAEQQIEASLKEKEVLLKEIHHRVKNNMQVISSLLNLQAGQTRDSHVRDMLKESQNRVKSMALIHERLYQSKDLAQIDFGDYVRSLTAHVFRSYNVEGIQLNVRVENIYLSVDTAIPCGLIINELVSNSLKHAFPRGRKGEIRVELKPNVKAQGYELTVSDSGVGFPEGLDFRTTESLGLQLVNTLTSQLEGTLALKKNGGTRFVVTFGSVNWG